jgi:DNA-binding response OmpR family regulator
MFTILLVDDVPQIREVVESFLTDEGFLVRTCDRAEAALAVLQRELPDLLILDGRLPGMSGWQCLALLRADDRTAKLPVLMLTAAPKDVQTYAGPGDLLDDPCTSYLTKPFDLDALLEAIQAVVRTCDEPACDPELVTA